jgi:hypothetical protein
MVKKILIVSANPKDTNKLRLDEEVREIQAALKRANNRYDFEIVTCWAVRVEDLRRALLDHQPTIVHFSGHGSGSTGLALENNSGQLQLVSTESLSRLFKLFQEQVECVVLNACLSIAQAEAIYQHIDYVIGMNRAIGDRAAIEFAIGFYDALGAGRTYEDCFELGCASIDLEGIPESEIPVLKARKRRSPTEPKTNSGKVVEVVSRESKAEQSNLQPSYGGISQSMSGGTMYGGMQAVQGNKNLQTMNTNVTSATEKPLTQQEVIELLAEIEQLIEEYPPLPAASKEKSLKYLGAAKEEAQATEPDKQLAAGNLKRMVETLKNADETGGSTKTLWENVKQILMQLHTWLDVAKNYFSF